MIPSTGTVSPGSTRRRSPIFTCSAGSIRSVPPEMTRAVWGVRWTSFSMPALALATVRSSSSAPNCMINATSPAAKCSPMQTEAISASDTSTSALMSKAVIRPMIASITIGIPQRIIAIHAASNGNGFQLKMLISRATPEITSNIISFFVPPSSISCSTLSMTFRIMIPSFYTYRGISILYWYRNSLSIFQ